MAFYTSIEPADISASKNDIPLELTVSGNWRSLSNYELQIRVQKETAYRSGAFYDYQILAATPTAQNRVKLNLSACLEGLVSAEPPESLSAAAPKRLESQIARYKVVIYEYVAGALTSSDTIGPKFVVRAGVGEFNSQRLINYSQGALFLTAQPDQKYTRPQQPEYLSLQIPIGAPSDTATVKTKILYLSGAESSTFSGAGKAYEAGDLLRFVVGYNQLNLGANPAPEPVIGYKIWIEDGSNNSLSNTQTYLFYEPKYCNPNSRYMIFENHLGGWDSIAITGGFDTAIEIEQKTAELIPDPARPSGVASLRQYETRFFEQQKGSSGLLSSGEKALALGLLTSEHVYRIGPSSPNPAAAGGLIPVNMLGGSIATAKDNDFTFQLEISFRDAFNNVGL